MPYMRETLYMAQKMVKRLGECDLLLREVQAS